MGVGKTQKREKSASRPGRAVSGRLPAMVELLPSFVIAAIGFYGWGRIAGAPVGTGVAGIGWSGLLGFTMAFLVGSAAHFWMPLKWVSPVFVGAGILITLLHHRRQFFDALRSGWRIVVPILVLCVLFSSRELIHGDTGSYHMQAVQWITEESAVYGLANLHGRFGFNTAWWVVAGMMQLPWMPSVDCLYLATGLLAFFFGLLVVDGLLRLWAGEGDAAGIIFACSTYLWFRQMAGINNPSLGTDAPANLLGVATAVCLVSAFSKRSLCWAGTGLLLATLALAVKLSAAVWLPGSLLTVLLVYRFAEGSRPVRLAALCGAGLFAVAAGGLWAIRGYICSGYPAYPSRLFGIQSFPWTVPASDIARDTAGVRDWPMRGGGPTNSVPDILWRWIDNQYGLTNMVFALVAAVAGLVGLFFLIRAVRESSFGTVFSKLTPFFVPAGTALAGLVFCFFAAPAMRFASGYFFALAGIAAVAVAGLFPVAASTISRTVVLLLVISAVALNFSGAVERTPAFLALPAFPLPQVEEKITGQGIVIQVPRPNAMAWNVRRPSTPYFDPGIRFEFTTAGHVKMITKSSLKQERSSE